MERNASLGSLTQARQIEPKSTRLSAIREQIAEVGNSVESLRNRLTSLRDRLSGPCADAGADNDPNRPRAPGALGEICEALRDIQGTLNGCYALMDDIEQQV